MKNKVSIKISREKLAYLLVEIPILIVLYGYLGVFTRYRLVPSLFLIVFLMVYILLADPKLCLFMEVKPWIFFGIYILVSAILFNTKTGFQYLIFIVIGILLYNIRLSNAILKKMMNSIICISVLFAFFTLWNKCDNLIIQKLFSPILHDGQLRTMANNMYYGGMPGLAGETSYNAFAMSMGIVILCAKILEQKKICVISKVSLGILLIGIYLTAKRSLLLINVTIVLLCIIIRVRKKYHISKVQFFMLIVGMTVVLSPFIYGVVMDILSKGGDTVQLSNREWFWGMAFELFRKNPICGSGINTFDFLYNQRKKASGYVFFAGAHNSYIQFLAELGVLGVLIFIWAVGSTLRKIFKDYKYAIDSEERYMTSCSVISQIMILIYALTENPFYQPQQILFYFLSVIISLNCKYNRKLRKIN